MLPQSVSVKVLYFFTLHKSLSALFHLFSFFILCSFLLWDSNYYKKIILVVYYYHIPEYGTINSRWFLKSIGWIIILSTLYIFIYQQIYRWVDRHYKLTFKKPQCKPNLWWRNILSTLKTYKFMLVYYWNLNLLLVMTIEKFSLLC